MVKVLIGAKGTGKTKQIIDLVNEAAEKEKGSVVCLAGGSKLTFDISHDARLVDVSGYKIETPKGLMAFIAGIHAGNYDISQVFIDSLYKVVHFENQAAVEEFLELAVGFASVHTIKFTIAISDDNPSEKMKKFIVD